MVTPSQPKERAERSVIADAIHRDIDRIESEWLQAVVKNLAPGGNTTDLRDAIGDYLQALAESLRHETHSDSMLSGEEAWARIAREHGLNRVQLGFDIGQLVREFILLRRVLVRRIRSSGISLKEDQIDRLSDLLESAMAVSVEAYVHHRDRNSRRMQAEHIGFITHELRNPLTVAMNTLSLLQRQLNEGLLSLANKAVTSLDQMNDLINNVLLTDAENATSLKVRPTDFTVGSLIETAIPLARQHALEKGLKLDLAFNPDLKLRADRALTESALRNLVGNAIKYTDSGQVRLVVEEKGTDVVFHVLDTGEGISPEELRTIFEPFKRGNTRKPGSGLGLSVARRAAEAQGGSIHVESSDDGSHFWIVIPKTCSPGKVAA